MTKEHFAILFNFIMALTNFALAVRNFRQAKQNLANAKTNEAAREATVRRADQRHHREKLNGRGSRVSERSRP